MSTLNMGSLSIPSALEESSFQQVLGEKLGALAFELMEEHHNSELQSEQDELHQLRSEVQDLRRQVGEFAHARAEMLPPSPISSTNVAESGQSRQTLDEGAAPVRPRDRLEVEIHLPAIEVHNSPSCTSPQRQISPISADAATIVQSLSKKSIPVKVKESVGNVFHLHRGKDLASDSKIRSNTTKLHNSTAEEFDLLHCFKQFDHSHVGYIDIEDILNACSDNFPEVVDDVEREDALLRYRRALLALNKFLGPLGFDIKSVKKKTAAHLNLTAFKVLMLGEPQDLEQYLKAEDVGSILHMRQCIVNAAVVSKVAKAWGVSQAQVRSWKEFKRGWFEMVLEPLVAVFIILNSLVIGISLDTWKDWEGWFAFEALFTVFFSGEFIIRLWMHGCFHHFLGRDFLWNIFDFFLVVFALIDTSWTLHSKAVGEDIQSVHLNKLTILRLARLVRITRIIRLVRLGIFKELALMVNGVIAGLRTLLWAMVLLLFFIYGLGVAMRQLTETTDAYLNCDSTYLKGTKVYVVTANGTETNILSDSCNRGQFMMKVYGQELFQNVPRAMLTVFNCFTDGCSVPDGTPLIWYLWDTHGGILVIAYVFSYLFVCFGVVNLVMAVFVENTFAQAWKHRQENHFGTESGHIAHAHHLHKLLSRLCRERYEGDGSNKFGTPGESKSVVSYTKRQLASITGFTSKRIDFEATHLQLRVSQEMFEYFLQDPCVQVILDDLEVSQGSREQLFNILDADGNGYLAISELVEGMMRLRGPADKGDAISTLLMVRSMQKQMRRFEADVLSNQKLLHIANEDLKEVMRAIQEQVAHREQSRDGIQWL